MMMTIAPFSLSFDRVGTVWSNHSLTVFRCVSDAASEGFRGTSMMMLPPRPMSIPSTLVARRVPPPHARTSVKSGAALHVTKRQADSCIKHNFASAPR